MTGAIVQLAEHASRAPPVIDATTMIDGLRCAAQSGSIWGRRKRHGSVAS
ncbi:hypothetical protein [Nonomuraea phyllanthi]|nr:hypothetical protein [Nonomuraea phyllanthi]